MSKLVKRRRERVADTWIGLCEGTDAKRNHASMRTPNKSESRGCRPWDIGGASHTGQITTFVFKK